MFHVARVLALVFIFTLALGSNIVSAQSRVIAAEQRVKQALAPALQKAGASLGNPVFIRLFKQTRELELWIEPNAKGKPYQLLKRFPICAFSGALGRKKREGDMQAPEGIYFVGKSQLNPASSFHLSFNLGYPNRFDQHQGFTGSALMVHGNCVSIGCYAMTDPLIEEIYWALHSYFLKAPAGKVQVQAFPFAVNETNLGLFKDHPEHAFWQQLAPIFEAFESSKVPPKVQIGQRYSLIK